MSKMRKIPTSSSTRSCSRPASTTLTSYVFVLPSRPFSFSHDNSLTRLSQSADQLRYVSRDISPSTGLPFVPQSVIERAFWQADSFTLSIPKTSVSMQSLSSHSAYSRGGAVRDGTAADDAADLGLSTTINPSLKPNRRGQTSSPFFLVPIDDTTRINDCSPNGDGEGDVSPPKKAKGLPSGAEGFFGLGKETRLGVPGSHGGVFGTEDEAAALRRFIQYEPLRIRCV